MCCIPMYHVSYHYHPPLSILSKQNPCVFFSHPGMCPFPFPFFVTVLSGLLLAAFYSYLKRNKRMGAKKWFKIIVKLKKSKKDKSKEEKSTREESSSIPNEGLMMDRTVPSKLMDDIAATRIQNAFRSFMARRTLHHLRGAEKFEALIQDHLAREQTATALSYIHSWSRIQEQIRVRRICMITEARIKQKKLETQLKIEAKIHELEVEWCNGSETMEEIISRLHQREEAAIKRERAMAYAFSHQWRPNCSQYFGQASYSLGKESWGWSWTERWVAARPWEVRVRVQTTKTKNLNGQVQKTKLDKMNHNESKVALAKPTLSNGKETGKGKENGTSGLSKNNVSK
ncbi:protein IQ-DOMAIN 1-like isoform X4 [Glycine soja]|uniref:protein IQ-DOMAIN 1-like isoform X4 n=1 Tax=Glycine soja TaxID=3848 RepID=UPI00103E707B|nr:protein IQ-DOMAIN 1-like isoform X4 [Glycine soja]